MLSNKDKLVLPVCTPFPECQCQWGLRALVLMSMQLMPTRDLRRSDIITNNNIITISSSSNNKCSIVPTCKDTMVKIVIMKVGDN